MGLGPAIAQLKTEADHKLQAVELERQWERKVAGEHVQHLKDTIASLEKQKDCTEVWGQA